MKAKFKVWIYVILIICVLALIKSYFFEKEEKNILLSSPPQRIICLDSSVAEVLYFLGVSDRIVGVTSYCKWPDELRKKPKVGRGFGDLNLEAIASLQPDIIFCWRGRDEKILASKNYRLFLIHSGGIEEVMRQILEISRVVGREEEGKKLVSQMQAKINEIKRKLNSVSIKPRVYFEGGTPFTTRAPGSLGNDLITMAGGINIAQNEKIAFPTLSNEFIIQSNPDIIIVEQYGVPIEEIKNRPGWQNISAVKNNRIYKVPSYYSYYSPRCIEGLIQFAHWFHPEVFE